jgi:hypothetical protein
MHLSRSNSKRRLGLAAVVGAAALVPGAALVAETSNAAPVAAAAAPTCPTSGLVVWLDTNGDGTAGSTFYKLELTNLSGRACTLRGYPGVSGVNLSGRQLGRAASRNASHTPATVTLARGAVAFAQLQVVEAGNFPSSTCHMTTAAGFRVYPPNRAASKLVPYPFSACTGSKPDYLTVGAVQK